MNKVILMGRLTADPDVRYTQGPEQKKYARYTLAVGRRFKKEGKQEADFIPCVAFGKSADFAEKYMKKGAMFAVIGRMQVRKWEKEGETRWATEVVIEEQNFCGSKKKSESNSGNNENSEKGHDGFYPIDELEDDDLPF